MPAIKVVMFESAMAENALSKPALIAAFGLVRSQLLAFARRSARSRPRPSPVGADARDAGPRQCHLQQRHQRRSATSCVQRQARDDAEPAIVGDQEDEHAEHADHELKDAGPPLLIQAIHAAANGDALIAPSVTARLLATFSDAPNGRPPAQPTEPLTAREEEVLLTVARGLTNSEIADELHISLSTVKTHLASLMAKLGARNRVEIAMWAHETDRIER